MTTRTTRKNEKASNTPALVQAFEQHARLHTYASNTPAYGAKVVIPADMHNTPARQFSTIHQPPQQ